MKEEQDNKDISSLLNEKENQLNNAYKIIGILLTICILCALFVFFSGIYVGYIKYGTMK